MFLNYVTTSEIRFLKNQNDNYEHNCNQNKLLIFMETFFQSLPW